MVNGNDGKCSVQIDSRGNWEYRTLGSTSYQRRRGTKEWSVVDKPPPDEPQLSLSLVFQGHLGGEPDHWSLFVAPEGRMGSVHQVNRDAESMYYTKIEELDILTSTSFKSAYTLSYLSRDQVGWVVYYAKLEDPPSAPDRESVTENCQGWVV